MLVTTQAVSLARRERDVNDLKEWLHKVNHRNCRESQQGQARREHWYVRRRLQRLKKTQNPSHHLKDERLTSKPEVVIAPPALYLLLTREHLRKGIEVAAQNIFDKPNGAFTGEISAEQLKDSGITWTILGHSERRQILQENDDFVASKTKAAVDSGLGVILCCGESLEQREAGETVNVVTKQLKAVADKVKDWSKIVVAYEPIWCVQPSRIELIHGH